ncbi:MAG: sugar nucleotide-binding protein [Candidatus Nezhaarchaeales archaeon]
MVSFALWIIERLRDGKTINALIDQWVSPTLNVDLAEMILEIIERKLTDVYHLAGATRISRYGFAKLTTEALNLNHELIRPITMDEVNRIASRPKDSSLDIAFIPYFLKPSHAFEERSKNSLHRQDRATFNPMRRRLIYTVPKPRGNHSLRLGSRLFSALFFGVYEEALVCGVGHLATVHSFPLGLMHLLITVGMA